ncbi:hypothetical protein CLDAP_36370 [Caldilinea aerophila DSM 14535 = NBRC 104270]|uniref:Transposase n=1 Tax=Caldilinea aerophila (strain DSM 14535 / JCM 11387 / NBRC 104270 / STL-6-O1) TaxID=926550 RepID=I0I8T9_CALAS|nr:hypothetical protein CLDAP_36370 [Caldilinea aerophila DSM 14535 = NBRC 104270]
MMRRLCTSEPLSTSEPLGDCWSKKSKQQRRKAGRFIHNLILVMSAEIVNG